MRKQRSKGFSFIVYALLIMGGLCIILPMYITFITPLKTMRENSLSFFSFPSSLYLGNFHTILTSPKYYAAFINTLYVTAGTLLFSFMLHPMMSYALSRSMQQKKGYKYLYYFLLAGIFIPFQVKMMPLVILMSRINMMNPTGLICLAIGGSTCESVFLYVSYLNAIPCDMEEAAYIDGASTSTTYRLIILPLMKPIIATVLIKNGLWMWNDFMMPLIILNRTWKNWTLTLFQYNFQTQYTTNYSLSFATFVMSMLPIMIFYVILQKHIIGGLTHGAIKD